MLLKPLKHFTWDMQACKWNLLPDINRTIEFLCMNLVGKHGYDCTLAPRVIMKWDR